MTKFKSKSNLSSSKYCYNMVFGITQDAINNTMFEYLQSLEDEEYIQVFVYKEDVPVGQSHFVAVDYKTLKQELGFDPFDIPNGTETSDERVEKLMELQFAFGFRTVKGWPLAYYLKGGTNDPEKMRKAIFEMEKNNPTVFLPGTGTTVDYNLFCKDFRIIATPGRYENKFHNYSQYDKEEDGSFKYDRPWTFTFKVDLDLSDDNAGFSSLPKDIQTKIESLNPNSTFSIQQLYLDLNSAKLNNSPKIVGFPEGSPIATELYTIFIENYLRSLKQGSGTTTDGNFLLGTSVKASKNENKSFIIPTDLNFEVSPYLKSEDRVSLKCGANTLNWLVMTDGASMPPQVPFDWNWVPEPAIGETYAADGVMAINRNVFVAHLGEILSTNLKSVCAVPDVLAEDTMLGVKYGWNIGWSKSPYYFEVVNDEADPSKILHFYYEKKAEDSTDNDPWDNYLKIKVKYYISINVYLENNRIKIVTEPTVNLYVDYDPVGPGDKTIDFNVAKYIETDYYDLEVDGYGKISTIHDGPHIEDKSKFPDLAWYEDLFLGDFKDRLEEVRDIVKVQVEGYLSNYEGRMSDLLNDTTFFILPAGKTFIFKNIGFSNYYDLVCDITYVDPT